MKNIAAFLMLVFVVAARPGAALWGDSPSDDLDSDQVVQMTNAMTNVILEELKQLKEMKEKGLPPPIPNPRSRGADGRIKRMAVEEPEQLLRDLKILVAERPYDQELHQYLASGAYTDFVAQEMKLWAESKRTQKHQPGKRRP